MNRKLLIRFRATSQLPMADLALKQLIRAAVSRTLDAERFPYDAEVSVTLCDNAYIHALNRKFRGVDRPTDVLSFPLYEDGEFDMTECIEGAVLGDVVISLERAAEQAAELCHSAREEVAFLTVHSVLHLLGYDHELSPEEEERQCERQRLIMKELRESEPMLRTAEEQDIKAKAER